MKVVGGAVKGCLLAASAVLVTFATNADAQPPTCFGGPAVMTCHDTTNGIYQVNCFGSSKYRNCFLPQGQSFSLSNTGGNTTNPSSSASLQTAPSGATMVPANPTATPATPTATPCPTPGRCPGSQTQTPGATATPR